MLHRLPDASSSPEMAAKNFARISCIISTCCVFTTGLVNMLSPKTLFMYTVIFNYLCSVAQLVLLFPPSYQLQKCRCLDNSCLRHAAARKFPKIKQSFFITFSGEVEYTMPTNKSYFREIHLLLWRIQIKEIQEVKVEDTCFCRY